jgi:hypothetical protein
MKAVAAKKTNKIIPMMILMSFLYCGELCFFLWDVAIDTYNRHEFFNYECPLGKPAGHECEGQPE